MIWSSTGLLLTGFLLLVGEKRIDGKISLESKIIFSLFSIIFLLSFYLF